MINGKIQIDTEGNIKTIGEIITKKINIEQAVDQIIIPAGEISAIIESKSLTEQSLIFVTPEKPAVIGAEKIDEKHFEVAIKEPLDEDLKVNWWIVN